MVLTLRAGLVKSKQANPIKKSFHNTATTHLMTDVFIRGTTHKRKADKKNVLVRQRNKAVRT